MGADPLPLLVTELAPWTVRRGTRSADADARSPRGPVETSAGDAAARGDRLGAGPGDRLAATLASSDDPSRTVTRNKRDDSASGLVRPENLRSNRNSRDSLTLPFLNEKPRHDVAQPCSTRSLTSSRWIAVTRGPGEPGSPPPVHEDPRSIASRRDAIRNGDRHKQPRTSLLRLAVTRGHDAESAMRYR